MAVVLLIGCKWSAFFLNYCRTLLFKIAGGDINIDEVRLSSKEIDKLLKFVPPLAYIFND